MGIAYGTRRSIMIFAANLAYAGSYKFPMAFFDIIESSYKQLIFARVETCDDRGLLKLDALPVGLTISRCWSEFATLSCGYKRPITLVSTINCVRR